MILFTALESVMTQIRLISLHICDILIYKAKHLSVEVHINIHIKWIH